MRFLADENCDRLVVDALRQLKHDVVFVSEVSPGTNDQAILRQAYLEQRIVITEDRDFCELVFRDQALTRGIILIRIPAANRVEKVLRIQELVNNYDGELLDAMTTLTLTKIPIKPLASGLNSLAD